MAFPAACYPRGCQQSAPFVGPLDLDTLIGQGAVVVAAYSVRKLRAEYAGQCCKLRGDGTGTPEADIPFTGGALDKSTVAALIASGGGTTAYWKNWYDQSGNGADATQGTGANQVNYSEGVFATGGLGGAAQANCWLDSIDGALLTAPFSIWVVCSNAPTTALRQLVQFGARGLYRTGPTVRRLTQNWGTALNSASTGLSNSKATLLGVSNGANSKIWLNGALKLTGNAGSNSPSGTMKIGAGDSLPTNNWSETQGGSITEVVVFSGDPTALAGWANFMAGAKTFFGTV